MKVSVEKLTSPELIVELCRSIVSGFNKSIKIMTGV